jgi:hypothetical protein
MATVIKAIEAEDGRATQEFKAIHALSNDLHRDMETILGQTSKGIKVPPS